MSKALIIYGSTTGNTEYMAESIQQALSESGLEADLKNVTDAEVAELSAGHSVVLLGCPAYGDDTIELQDDFQEFFDQLDSVKLDGQRFAVFAPGDSSYEHFCGSVKMLEVKMEEIGGKMVREGLKIDGDPGDFEEEIVGWAESIAASCQ